MKILFIVNPVAGTDKAKSLIPLIKSKMDNAKVDYDLVLTNKPKDATDITINGLNEGYDIIVAVGGDGTVGEVAKGIMLEGHGTLGIIPGGTGNDLARSLNMPISPEEALTSLIKGQKKSIDIGSTNQGLFLNVGSTGFDAEIVKNTENIKKHVKGKLAYTAGLLKTLIKYKSRNYRIELDGKVLENKYLLIAVGNGSYYGGGMKICPMAVINDGYFHVCVINDINKLLLLTLFPLIFSGKHQYKKKHVEFYKSKQVKISTDGEIYLNLDGEISSIKNEIVFSISDKKIEVACEA